MLLLFMLKKVLPSRINLLYINKDDAINIMSSSNLMDKIDVFYKKKKLYIKDERLNLLSKNRDVILNRAKDYYMKTIKKN